MIAWLEGVLKEKTPGRVILDVAGVGYELLISLSTFARLPDAGKTIAVYARTVAREDALLLYGFATSIEREIFDLLLKANRVGPKLAQTILSGIDPDLVLRGLRDGDVKLLSSAPGVGKKMAERMVLELRERAGELASEGWSGRDAAPNAVADPDSGAETREQVISALLNLGYPKPQAERVVGAAAIEAGDAASIEELVRVALRRLAR
jgi:Holliday junction DNA helicase RuvA